MTVVADRTNRFFFQFHTSLRPFVGVDLSNANSMSVSSLRFAEVPSRLIHALVALSVPWLVVQSISWPAFASAALFELRS